MENVFFSTDGMSDELWSPPEISSSSPEKQHTMNRSDSEWAFRRFIQEASNFQSSGSCSSSHSSSSSFEKVNEKQPLKTTSFGGENLSISIDSEEYQAFLKSQLNLACAAVALTRGSFGKPPNFAPLHDNASQASNGSGFDLSGEKDKVACASGTQKKSGFQVWNSAISVSSKDLSDNDEAEGETDTTDNKSPFDAKRLRRMLSNRESARRSRSRKQEHLSELETRVSELKVENSTLQTHLSNLKNKYNDASVHNRILKADVETMRTKVKMAEEAIKRSGITSLFQTMPEMSDIQSLVTCSSDTSSISQVLTNDQAGHHFYQQPVPINLQPYVGSMFNSGLTDVSIQVPMNHNVMNERT